MPMKREAMSLEQRVDYLGGQVSALNTMFMALMGGHPDRRALQDALIAAIEVQKAGTIPARVPEPYVQGQADQYDVLLALVGKPTAP